MTGTYGTFTLGPDGAWTYTLHNTDEDTDALGAGQKKTEAFTVESLGGTTAHVVVTVTGADDAAVIGGDTEGAVTEDDVEFVASGTLTVSDPDADQDGFEVQAEVGTYGKFALGEDGEWTYTLDNTDEDTDALGAGQKKTEAFTVESLGGTTAHVVVTVTGADDAAVIGGDTEGAVTEDDVEFVASGTLTVSDPDADQDGFEVQAEVGTYGKFALGEDGEWTYTLDNTDEDTDALGAGQKKTEAFTVESLGGTTAHVVVTVTGADDAAVIGGDTEGAVTEDDVEIAASGTLTVSDPDADQDGFEVQAEVGTYGKFALGEDGEWTYTLDNTDEDTDALGAGQKKTEAFTVESLGGTTAHVVVTVTGADDAAVIGGDTEGAVTEDDVEIAASGTLTVSDPDADQDGFEVQAEVGTYGKFALGEDGEWTYTLDNTDEDTDALGAGQKKTEAFTVESLGGTTAARGGHGDGCGRRGGDWRGHRGRGDRGRCGRGAGERDADRERPGCGSRRVRGTDGGGDVREVRTGRGRGVDVHAGQHGRGHRRAGCGRDGDGHVHGREPGRHHGAGRDRGEGRQRSGGDWRGHRGRGDRGRCGDRGERDADRERPGCGSRRVRGTGGGGDVREVRTGRGTGSGRTRWTTRTRTPTRWVRGRRRRRRSRSRAWAAPPRTWWSR